MTSCATHYRHDVVYRPFFGVNLHPPKNNYSHSLNQSLLWRTVTMARPSHGRGHSDRQPSPCYSGWHVCLLWSNIHSVIFQLYSDGTWSSRLKILTRSLPPTLLATRVFHMPSLPNKGRDAKRCLETALTIRVTPAHGSLAGRIELVTYQSRILLTTIHTMASFGWKIFSKLAYNHLHV